MRSFIRRLAGLPPQVPWDRRDGVVLSLWRICTLMSARLVWNAISVLPMFMFRRSTATWDGAECLVYVLIASVSMILVCGGINSVTMFRKLIACYKKCTEVFFFKFKFERWHNVTDMLHELGLPGFELCVDRSKRSWLACLTALVGIYVWFFADVCAH